MTFFFPILLMNPYEKKPSFRNSILYTLTQVVRDTRNLKKVHSNMCARKQQQTVVTKHAPYEQVGIYKRRVCVTRRKRFYIQRRGLCFGAVLDVRRATAGQNHVLYRKGRMRGERDTILTAAQLQRGTPERLKVRERKRAPVLQFFSPSYFPSLLCYGQLVSPR